MAPTIVTVDNQGKAQYFNKVTKEPARRPVHGTTPRVPKYTVRRILHDNREEYAEKEKSNTMKAQIKINGRVRKLGDTDGHGDRWLTRTLMAYRHMAAKNAGGRGWWYKDSNNIIRGPYSSTNMRHWMERGKLSKRLLVRFGDHGTFQRVEEYFPKLQDFFPSEDNIPNDLVHALISLRKHVNQQSVDAKFS